MRCSGFSHDAAREKARARAADVFVCVSVRASLHATALSGVAIEGRGGCERAIALASVVLRLANLLKSEAGEGREEGGVSGGGAGGVKERPRPHAEARTSDPGLKNKKCLVFLHAEGRDPRNREKQRSTFSFFLFPP